MTPKIFLFHFQSFVSVVAHFLVSSWQQFRYYLPAQTLHFDWMDKKLILFFWPKSFSNLISLLLQLPKIQLDFALVFAGVLLRFILDSLLLLFYDCGGIFMFDFLLLSNHRSININARIYEGIIERKLMIKRQHTFPRFIVYYLSISVINFSIIEINPRKQNQILPK